MMICTSIIILTGSFSYSVYAQYTESIILLNLSSTGINLNFKMLYSAGVLFSYCIQIVPTFKILDTVPLYKMIPTSIKYPGMKLMISKIVVVVICCTIAFNVRNIGSFLNLQGAVCGFLLTFLYPIIFYFKST